jgi:5-(carboxyamino)imidazole ribonucleotide synthase
MFAAAANRLGYCVHTFSPENDPAAPGVNDVTASYEDSAALSKFAKNVSVVTFASENVPPKTIATLSKLVPVRPSLIALETTQHRAREKTFLSKTGFPVTPFRIIKSVQEGSRAIQDLPGPWVLKTAGFGSDGLGQRNISSEEDLKKAFKTNGSPGFILETFVDFECELSVIAARSENGEFAHYGVMQNEHRRRVLDLTVFPAPVGAPIIRRVVDLTRHILKELQVVGVMCVEYFLTKRGDIWINELVPRPHNSGHLTIDACATSQFDQQLRAVCGLPLGPTDMIHSAAMANLLGDLWVDGAPQWERVLSLPDVKLHLYGKKEPRKGRKMGHITALAATAADARRKVLAARSLLTSAN